MTGSALRRLIRDKGTAVHEASVRVPEESTRARGLDRRQLRSVPPPLWPCGLGRVPTWLQVQGARASWCLCVQQRVDHPCKMSFYSVSNYTKAESARGRLRSSQRRLGFSCAGVVHGTSRLREAKLFVWGHTAGKRQSQDSNSVYLTLKTGFPAPLPPQQRNRSPKPASPE